MMADVTVMALTAAEEPHLVEVPKMPDSSFLFSWTL